MLIRPIVVVGVLLAGGVSCSRGGTDAEKHSEGTTTGVSAPEITATSIKDSTVLLLAELETILDPQVRGWDCEGENPQAGSMNLIEAYDSLSRNCVWSEVDGVIKISFRCFLSTQYKPEEREKCRDQLNLLASDAGIISLAEAALIPEQAPIDGLQTSSTGITSWKVGDGVNFVVDVDKWAVSNT